MATPRLRILKDGAIVSDIELLSGVNRIGSSTQNDIQIDDASISSAHCEIVIEGERAVLRDLGSTNGTFAGYERVTELTVLRHGQGVRMGDVQMIFEHVPPLKVVAPPPPPLPSPGPETSSTCCPYHPSVIGKLICKGCHKWFCPNCVNVRRVMNKDLTFCRMCGEECIATEIFFAEPPAAPNFYHELPGAFAYPFRGEGLMIFISGTLLYLVLHGMSYAAVLGGMIAGIFILVGRMLLAGYIVASVQKLIEYSAQGDNRPFVWPEFSELMGDIIYPVFLFLGTSVICFGPAIVALFAFPPAAIPLFVLGAFYLPMGMLAVALFDTLSGLNPLLILLSILKVPLQYLVACGVLLLALGAELGIRWLLESLVTTPFLIVLFSSPIAFYFIVVETRVLGLLYYTNKARLGWFS